MLGRVNYLGHVAVALATGRDDPSFILGAALPDLASMVGVRFDRRRLPDAVGDGVLCHLAADEAFHALPAFRDGSAALRLDLRAIGLATGPTRAIGHAGWELLLDGTFVGGPVEVAYRLALDGAEAVLDALEPAGQRRWMGLLARRPVPPLRYDEPAWVADRLHAMLNRRPRLAFEQVATGPLSEVLARHQARIWASAAQAMEAVAP
jgi:hypothetical protein